MTTIKTRLHIAQDGSLRGRAEGAPVGEHDAEIVLTEPGDAGGGPEVDMLLRRVRAIQAEIARLPVLDARRPEEILGFNQHGHFD